VLGNHLALDLSAVKLLLDKPVMLSVGLIDGHGHPKHRAHTLQEKTLDVFRISCSCGTGGRQRHRLRPRLTGLAASPLCCLTNSHRSVRLMAHFFDELLLSDYLNHLHDIGSMSTGLLRIPRCQLNLPINEAKSTEILLITLLKSFQEGTHRR